MYTHVCIHMYVHMCTSIFVYAYLYIYIDEKDMKVGVHTHDINNGNLQHMKLAKTKELDYKAKLNIILHGYGVDEVQAWS